MLDAATKHRSPERRQCWRVRAVQDKVSKASDGRHLAKLLIDDRHQPGGLCRKPKGMRVIARKERPHPGAQLRITDVDGLSVTAFATNSRRGQLADLELPHRRRARCQDRIRGAKDTGLRNLPLHDMDQNRIWCALVALACELTAWMQMLALASQPAAGGNPNGSACGCSASPHGLPAPAGGRCCLSARPAAGPTCS